MIDRWSCYTTFPLQIGNDINLFSGIIIVISSYLLWMKFDSKTSEIYQINEIDKIFQQIFNKSMTITISNVQKSIFRKEIIVSVIYIAFFAAISAYNIHIISCDIQ